MRPSTRMLAAAGALSLLIAACGGTPAPAGTSALDHGAASSSPVAGEAVQPTVEDGRNQNLLTPVTLGLPYRPDVQFTPLYVADAKGYFADRGLDVTFEYGDESGFLRLAAAGKMDGVIASGEQVVLARASDIPATYVMTWYQRFPGVVFSLDPAITSAEDLIGRKVGLPAPSGASYLGWQALLAANDIDSKAVTTEIVGFEQLAAVLDGRVDAAVGYASNEPVQLRAEGLDPSVIEIADAFNLVSNGLVVGEETAETRPEVVQGLVDGILLGIRDTLDEPDAAFEIALRAVPEADDPAVRDRQREVLRASMPYWDAPLLGAIDRDAWRDSQDFLVAIGLIADPTPLDELVDGRFVQAAEVNRP